MVELYLEAKRLDIVWREGGDIGLWRDWFIKSSEATTPDGDLSTKYVIQRDHKGFSIGVLKDDVWLGLAWISSDLENPGNTFINPGQEEKVAALITGLRTAIMDSFNYELP